MYLNASDSAKKIKIIFERKIGRKIKELLEKKSR